MNNNLQIFKNNEFGEIRVVTKDNEPWFVGKDISERLGYKDTSDSLKRHVDDEDKGVGGIPTPGGKQNMKIVNESGLYCLILSSKLPNAKKFKRWVTSEVLPSIRQTGGYIQTNESDDEETIMAKAILLAQKTIDKQKVELQEKDRFINQIAVSKNSLLVREVAKAISKSDTGLVIGEKRLYEKLRSWDLIFKKSTEPKQSALERGLFEVVEGTRTNSSGVFTYQTTRVTGKGQAYILKKLIKEQDQEQISMIN
jgi:anti-repressor protein